MNFPPGSKIDAVVELGINEWNGRKDIQVRIIDIRPAEGEKTIQEKMLAKENV